MMLTQALALSASQLVHEKKSQRIYTSRHWAGLELTKLTYTRLEDNLIRHRATGYTYPQRISLFCHSTIHLPRLGKTLLSRSMRPYLLCFRLKQTYPTMSVAKTGCMATRLHVEGYVQDYICNILPIFSRSTFQ